MKRAGGTSREGPTGERERGRTCAAKCQRCWAGGSRWHRPPSDAGTSSWRRWAMHVRVTFKGRRRPPGRSQLGACWASTWPQAVRAAGAVVVLREAEGSTAKGAGGRRGGGRCGAVAAATGERGIRFGKGWGGGGRGGEGRRLRGRGHEGRRRPGPGPGERDARARSRCGWRE